MRVDRRLVAAAAVLVLCNVSGEARAWQRPKAQPAQKVEACAEMGEGYVRVPGTTTCIKLSGLVRVEAAHGGGGSTLDPSAR